MGICKEGKGVRTLCPYAVRKVAVSSTNMLESAGGRGILISFGMPNAKVGRDTFCRSLLVFGNFAVSKVGARTMEAVMGDAVSMRVGTRGCLGALFSGKLAGGVMVRLADSVESRGRLGGVRRGFKGLCDGKGHVFAIPTKFGMRPMGLSLTSTRCRRVEEVSVDRVTTLFNVGVCRLGSLGSAGGGSLRRRRLDFLMSALLVLCRSVRRRMA